MSEKSREHLSSLMDGEVSAETGRFLLRRLGSDEDLCATWARYHLVRDCLRHDGAALHGEELCRRVQRVLAGESPPRAAAGRSRRWLRPVAGGAIAATVALMAVMVVGPGREAPTQAPADLVRAQPSASFVNPDGFGFTPATRAASLAPPPGTQARMNRYLLRHYQATGGANGRGLVTFVPVMVQRAAEAAPAEAPREEREDGSRSGQ